MCRGGYPFQPRKSTVPISRSVIKPPPKRKPGKPTSPSILHPDTSTHPVLPSKSRISILYGTGKNSSKIERIDFIDGRHIRTSRTERTEAYPPGERNKRLRVNAVLAILAGECTTPRGIVLDPRRSRYICSLLLGDIDLAKAIAITSRSYTRGEHVEYLREGRLKLTEFFDGDPKKHQGTRAEVGTSGNSLSAAEGTHKRPSTDSDNDFGPKRRKRPAFVETPSDYPSPEQSPSKSSVAVVVRLASPPSPSTMASNVRSTARMASLSPVSGMESSPEAESEEEVQHQDDSGSNTRPRENSQDRILLFDTMWESTKRDIERIKEENKRLKQQTENLEDEVANLRVELEIADSRAENSESEARKLTERIEGLKKELDEERKGYSEKMTVIRTMLDSGSRQNAIG